MWVSSGPATPGKKYFAPPAKPGDFVRHRRPDDEHEIVAAVGNARVEPDRHGLIDAARRQRPDIAAPRACRPSCSVSGRSQ